ncbi:MAG: hypothetical protein LBW85_07660, partial [Deltaproteobacteria bacterium]|nr:hypothetical protein [Deltaproteobacteria bacterium]
MSDKYYNRKPRTLPMASADQYDGQVELFRFVVGPVAKTDLERLSGACARRGSSHYPFGMMPAPVPYAHVKGVTGGSETEGKLKDSLSFMCIDGGLKPDHSAMAAFKTLAIPFFEYCLKRPVVLAAKP